IRTTSLLIDHSFVCSDRSRRFPVVLQFRLKLKTERTETGPGVDQGLAHKMQIAAVAQQCSSDIEHSFGVFHRGNGCAEPLAGSQRHAAGLAQRILYNCRFELARYAGHHGVVTRTEEEN